LFRDAAATTPWRVIQWFNIDAIGIERFVDVFCANGAGIARTPWRNDAQRQRFA